MFPPKLLTMILNLKPNYLVWKSFPKGKYFAIILQPYIVLKNRDFFITYKEGFNLHTVKRNLLQLPEDEHCTRISTQLHSGELFHTQNNSLFLL